MITFSTTPDALSPEQLTNYLKASGALCDGRVVSAQQKIIGTGKMGDNARFTLCYEGDRTTEFGRAPDTLIAKFPAADEHARAMAGAHGAYYNEVMFYRHLAASTSMRTPKIYGSELSDDRASFLLLMEDMAPAEPGNNLLGESRENAALALGEVAKLAADFYGDTSLEHRDYVVSAARDDGGAFAQSLMQQSWPGFVDRFGHGLTPQCIAFGEHYVDNVCHFFTRYQGPKTLIHGDFRSENILFTSDQAAIVDWQTVSESSVLADAAYFLGGSVSTEDRRSWEQSLITEYHRSLAAEGVDIPFKECWEQYREYAMHGLVIIVLGASFSSADERSDRMFLALIQRHLQHCVDVNAIEFLP
ncbi:MAG: phosphotransferase [Halioglobus sp.]|nr:phosphotransferase [Halioglobus sp.]